MGGPAQEIKVCPEWKKLYKAVDLKAKVKKEAVRGQYQCGAAHGALKQVLEPHQTNQANGTDRLVTDFNEYFDNLAVAATTEKTVLEELVRSNASLPTTDAEFFGLCGQPN